MATYAELRQLFNDSTLRNRVEVACIIVAEAIRVEDGGTANHANRVIWAKQAFISPGSVRDQMLMALLAANKDASVATIQAAIDGTIQAAVDAAVDMFADGS